MFVPDLDYVGEEQPFVNYLRVFENDDDDDDGGGPVIFASRRT